MQITHIKKYELPDESIWTAWDVPSQGGTGRLLGTACSLARLIEILPEFGYRQTDDAIRVRLQEHLNLSEDELLALIDFNKGGRGLDISHCKLWDVNLSMDAICVRRREYSAQHGFDPKWWKPSAGLDIRGITAVKTEFVHSKLDSADLSGARLSRALFVHASLRDADFEGATLDGAMFGAADLTNANFSLTSAVRASFSIVRQPARMEGVSLYGAVLDKAELSGVRFDQIVGLEHVSLKGCRLWGANLKDLNLQLLEPGALSGVRLLDAMLDRTKVRRDHFGPTLGEEVDARNGVGLAEGSVLHPAVTRADLFDLANQVYRELKVNFGSVGRTEDAAWAHFKQRDMYRLALNNRRSSRIEFRSSWLLCLDSLSRWTTGYGEKPWRPIGTAIAVIAIFSLSYRLLGAHTGDEYTVLRSIVYSGSSFFSIAFAAYEPKHVTTQLLTVIEAGLGIVVLGLYLWTIANASGRN